MGWSIAVCPSPCHEVDAESVHRVDAQWLQVDRGATIGMNNSTLNLMIIILLRAYSSHCGVEGVEGTYCLVEVAMLLRPPQVQLA